MRKAWPQLIVSAAAIFLAVGTPISAGSDLTTAPLSDLGAVVVRIDTLWASGCKDSAAVLTKASIVLARANRDSIPLIDLLNRVGKQGCFFGRLGEAEVHLREAIDLTGRLDEPARERDAMRWLGIAVERQGRPSEAKEIYTDLCRRSQSSGDTFHEGWARIGLAWDAILGARSGEAGEQYRLAIELFRQVGETEGEIWSLSGLGHTLASQGKLRKARDSYQASCDLSVEKGFLMSEAMALNDIGSIEFYLGDPGGALEMFERAREIQEARGSLFQTITPSINIALCHNELGRFGEAEKTLEECLETCRAQGYGTLETTVLVHLASLQGRRGLRREAIRIYRRILGSSPELTVRVRAKCLEGVADNLIGSDSAGAAIGYLEEELTLLGSGDESDLLPRLHDGLGQCYEALDRPKEALQHYLIGIDAAAKLGQRSESVHLHAGAGRAYLALDQPDRALQTYLRGAELWEALRDLPLDPTWRENEGAAGHDLYTQLASLLIRCAEGHPDRQGSREAFDRLQGFKARTLLERMMGPGEELGRRIDAVGIDLATLEELQQNSLRSGELFLDFYLGADVSILFAVTTDTLRATILPGEEHLGGRLKRYLQLVSRPPGEGGESTNLDVLQRTAGSLSDLLFTDVKDLIGASESVLISTDGLLGLAPLHQIYADAEWIRHWIRVPSASIFMKLRRADSIRTVFSARILALAGGRTPDGELLHGSLGEVRDLGRCYADVEVRTNHAPEDSIAALLDGPTVLHFASHLKVDNENPWQSEFQLLEPGSPGNLRAFEISTMKLPARLAVLSSCASAGGRIVSGEGVIGVTGAFLSAGVPAIVATLWPVDDRSTARLMEEFYTALADGETAVAALHRSQAALHSDPELRHPFYWAGFVLVGDGDVTIPLKTRFDPGHFATPAVIGALILVCAIGIIRAVRRGSRSPTIR